MKVGIIRTEEIPAFAIYPLIASKSLENKEISKIVKKTDTEKKIIEDKAEIDKVKLEYVKAWNKDSPEKDPTGKWKKTSHSKEARKKLAEKLLLFTLQNGLWSMLMRNAKDFQNLQEVKTEKGTLKALTFETTEEVLYKACFGCCVDSNGFAKEGFGKIINIQKKLLQSYLDKKKKDFPELIISENGKDAFVMLEEIPMSLEWLKDDVYKVELKTKAFNPTISVIEKEKYKACRQFLTIPCGLPTMIRYGASIVLKETESRINVLQIYKIILTIYAKINFKAVQGIYIQDDNGCKTAVFTRTCVKELFPQALKIKKIKDNVYETINSKLVNKILDLTADISNTSWNKANPNLSKEEREMIYRIIPKDADYPKTYSHTKDGKIIEKINPRVLKLRFDPK